MKVRFVTTSLISCDTSGASVANQTIVKISILARSAWSKNHPFKIAKLLGVHRRRSIETVNFQKNEYHRSRVTAKICDRFRNIWAESLVIYVLAFVFVQANNVRKESSERSSVLELCLIPIDYPISSQEMFRSLCAEPLLNDIHE